MAKERSAPLKLNFTVKGLEALKPPATGRIYVYDLRTPSLCVCVTENATKTFYLYRRVGGKPQRVRLGTFPPLTIDQARDLAARTHSDITYGVDPNAEKAKARKAATLGEVWEHYLENSLKAKRRERTRVTNESRWKTCLADWKDWKLASITRQDVVALHGRLGRDRGKTTANRAIQLLRALYNYADDPMGIKLENPAKKIELFAEEQRTRFLQADEIPRFFAAVEAEPDESLRDFFLLALWTGARRSNVQAMAWRDLNLPGATWTIPGSQFKTGKPVTVALTPEAMAILLRRAETIISPWVFPSHGKTGHLMEPKIAWDRIRKAAGMPDLRIHDLRRTLGSWQAALGTSLHVIGKSLGHATPAATAIYSRLALDPVRQAVTAATAAISEAAKKPK